MENRPPRRPTVIDIAREAGVSPGTVSNALGDRRRVDPVTKARVKAVAEVMGYSPNTQAQRLRGGSAGAIGLFITLPFAQAAGPTRFGFTMEIAAVAAAIAAENELALILVPPMHGARTVPRFLDMDGALFVEPVAGNPLLTALRKRGTPVVTIGPEPGAPEQPFVDLHTGDTVTMLLQHLFDQGCRNILLMTSVYRHDMREAAVERYLRFAQDFGMPIKIVELGEQEGEDGARTLALSFLARSPEIDGICAPYDPFAIGCLKAAADVNRVRPGAVKIVTRYNSIGVQQNDITAVDLHLPTAASLAIGLLLERMSGKQTSLCVSSEMPALIPAASSASP